jgi:mannose-6-phosphate isomerase
LLQGTHPSGPATLTTTGEPLKDWLATRPELVGTVPPGYPLNDLPFLFKILSIETALSIQVLV